MSLEWFRQLFVSSRKDSQSLVYLETILGYRPRNSRIFELALIHSSAAKTNADGIRESNERLEYLGDAVLGFIVADYLFKKYPFKDEGFLTDIRSRIVNRESLNELGRKVGLDKVLIMNSKLHTPQKSIYGDAMEAIIGAVYLDRGYDFCKSLVLERLIEPYFDLDEIILTNPNAKSQIIEWAQKQSKELVFDTEEISENQIKKEFRVNVILDGKVVGTGFGTSKKKAEQNAAQKSLDGLNLNDSEQ